MGEKLKSMLGLVDEREEVYFLLLLALIAAAVPTGHLTGLEALAGVGTMYGMLLGSSAYKKKLAREKSDGTR